MGIKLMPKCQVLIPNLRKYTQLTTYTCFIGQILIKAVKYPGALSVCWRQRLYEASKNG